MRFEEVPYKDVSANALEYLDRFLEREFRRFPARSRSSTPGWISGNSTARLIQNTYGMDCGLRTLTLRRLSLFPRRGRIGRLAIFMECDSAGDGRLRQFSGRDDLNYTTAAKLTALTNITIPEEPMTNAIWARTLKKPDGQIQAEFIVGLAGTAGENNPNAGISRFELQATAEGKPLFLYRNSTLTTIPAVRSWVTRRPGPLWLWTGPCKNLSALMAARSFNEKK